MTPEEHIKTCSVIKCINAPSNSKVNFFSFPEVRCQSYQRNRWVQVIKNKNGRWWMPSEHSLICSDHFVKGQPSTNPQDTDFVPSVFVNKRKGGIKSRAVSVKKFGLEYIKHDVLLKKSSKATDRNERKCAYVKLAAALGIAVTKVRAWERRFRDYFEDKMADPPDKRKLSADGKPHWLTTVAKRLSVNHMPRLSARVGGGAVSPGGVVEALCAAARARGSLCSTALYNDVRRVLRLSSAINDLHAVWVSAQRVSLQQVLAAGRAGDAAHAAPPPAAAAVVDLVLLHTDVDIVTDESVTLYEESAALHTLWQLIQRHRLEDAAPAHSRVRAQRWTRALRSYLDSGRTVSLVVLQRRWYELKLQARVRLAIHWRRPPGPQLLDDLTLASDPAPHELYPRPAPLHIAILKRYPHIATGQFKTWQQQVLEGTIVTELLEEENDVKETQSSNNEQSTDITDTGDDAAVKQLCPNMCKVEQSTFDEPMVEKPTDNDPLTEGPTNTDLLEEDNDVQETKCNVNEQSTDTTDTADEAALKQLYPNMSRVEQPTVDEPKKEPTFYNVPLVEWSTADNRVAGQTTDSDLLAMQSMVDKPKIEQGIDYDLLNNQSMVRTLADNPKGYAGNAATADKLNMLDTTDTQGGPEISSEQIHRAEDKSNEVIPLKRAYSSDTEDNLVIDECSNKIPCSLKLEPAPHTETHSFDTVSPHAAFRNIAPTIEVLHLIDPTTVKTEILFESDEDDFEPCNEEDKDETELDATKEISFISNRIMFVDEERGVSCDVKSENDVTGRMDWEDEQKMDDPENDTPTMDPKLLMDAQVRLFRIDKIRTWRKNVRKDKSIRVSRIHRKYYTPKPKTECNNTKTRTQNTCLDVELRTSARLNSTTTKTQEIRVDKSCLDEVAKTHSIRQLCSNIKRELIEEQLELLEGKTPNKKPKTESDSDDEKPLLVIREGKLPRETTDETKETVPVREMVEESSSDDELLNDEMFNKQRGGEERKRGRGAYYAASTIEWSSAFAPALERVAKRVWLPDIESVRRYNSSMQVAQVVPITTTVGAYGDGAMQAEQTPDDAVADETPEAATAAPAQHAESGRWDGAGISTDVASHTNGLPTFHENGDMLSGLLPSSPPKPLAWRALDLPADDELQAALDDLTTAPAAEAVLERSHCCAARRHREVNDSRRRIGLAEIPLHNHPDGVCTCCCTHLSDADARLRLDQQLRALHQDIEQMLWKSAGGRIQPKPAQTQSRSPSPARAFTSATTATATTSAQKQATKDAPSNTATVAKGSKAKPANYTNRPKRRRTRARAPAAPEPPAPAPLVNDFEEWQRQKNMNAKYFHINSNFSYKKDKRTSVQGTAVQRTTAQATAIQSTTTQGTAVQRTTAQATAIQSTTTQGRAVKSTTAQGPAVESTTAQASDVQSTIAQGRSVKSTTAQRTVVKSTTARGPAVESTTAQATAVQSTIAQGRAVKSTTAQRTVVRSTTAQGPAVESSTTQATAVKSSIAQGRAVQSTTAQRTIVKSTIWQGTAEQSPTAQNCVAQSTTPQTVTKQSTTAQSATSSQNIVQPGLMPYIRQSRLVSLLDEPRGRRVPVSPLRTALCPVAIAPKPTGKHRASDHAKHKTVVDVPAPTTEGTKNLTIPNYQSQAAGSRRMNLTTEQVSEPTQPVQVMSGPTDKPVSILEEYSRTLSIETVNNKPVVNALSLRVPSGPQESKTTIVMALTLPSDDVIKQTINTLYANDTVDLTEDPETSKSVITKPVSDQKICTPVDLVAAVKSLMNPVDTNKSGRSLLKHVTATNSGRSLLKTMITNVLDKPPNTTMLATVAKTDKAPKIMSLSNKLHDGDVIEIYDTDSNHSNNSDDNQSCCSSNKSSIFINKSSNPTVYTNKGSNQAKSDSAKESSDQTTSRTDERSEQAASNSNEAVSNTNNSAEAVSKTNENSSQACTTNSINQAVDKDNSTIKPSKTKKKFKVRNKIGIAKTIVSKMSNVSVEAVSSHSVARPCSRIPVLTSLTDGSLRCPARFANVASMTEFMDRLRRAAVQADKEVYCHKWSAVEQPVSALPCGGTLLCVDGSRPPLILPAAARGQRERATPHALAHLVLTDADPPCALPTYWTLSAFGRMARVMPDELVSTDAADVADVPDADDAPDAEPRCGGARWCRARGEWITAKEDKKICEKNHNFKILTAFCSADGIRQAARAGASLLLLSVRRARVVVLTLQRHEARGVVRHRASADVDKELLWELEVLLDEAEIDEELGGRADIISQ